MQLLYVVLCILRYTLCFARFVSFLACDAACRFPATCSKSTCSNWMTSWASFVDGLRSFRESEDVITDLLEFSFHFCDVLPRVRRVLLLLCAIRSSLSATSAADRALPSLQSTWLLQRPVTVCCPSCCFCVISLLNSAAFCFSPSISDSISTWCSLAFSAIFNSCSVAMC